MSTPIYTLAAFRASYLPGDAASAGTARGPGSGRVPRVRGSGISDAVVRFQGHLYRSGRVFTLAVRATIVEAQHGTRHHTLLTIAARLIRECWTDTDIRTVVMPAVQTHWTDVDPDEVMRRLDGQLAWLRRKEAERHATPVPDRAARLPRAFAGRRP